MGMMLFVLKYVSVAKIIGFNTFLFNAMSVSQALFFFLRFICVNDKNGLPLSVVSLLCKDPTPGAVGQVGVVGQVGGTMGRCELIVGELEV